MADISMCANSDCNFRAKCYRYTAKPNDYRQSYIRPDTESCNHFWDSGEVLSDGFIKCIDDKNNQFRSGDKE